LVSAGALILFELCSRQNPRGTFATFFSQEK